MQHYSRGDTNKYLLTLDKESLQIKVLIITKVLLGGMHFTEVTYRSMSEKSLIRACMAQRHHQSPPQREWWPIKSGAVQWTVFSRQLGLCESQPNSWSGLWLPGSLVPPRLSFKSLYYLYNLGVEGLNKSVQFQGLPERRIHLPLEHSVSSGTSPWRWKALSLEEIRWTKWTSCSWHLIKL